jgi:outer membrane protein OmpA-like peptidoglycan-associated protein
MSDTIRQELDGYRLILKGLRTLYASDGTITPEEQQILDALDLKIDRILAAMAQEHQGNGNGQVTATDGETGQAITGATVTIAGETIEGASETTLHGFPAHGVDLTQPHKEELNRLVIRIRDGDTSGKRILSVHIVGHAATWSDIKPAEYRARSLARADAARQYLEGELNRYEISFRPTITIEGRGDSEPIVDNMPNSTSQTAQHNRALNRRIEIFVKCDVELDPILGGPGSVSYSVTDCETGEPIPGATVTISGETIDGQSDGVFIDIASGVHEVRASAIGYTDYHQKLIVPPGQEVELIIELTAESLPPPENLYGTVKFTVTDIDTLDPIVRATIELPNQSSETNSLGEAEFTLPPGKFTYHLGAEGYEEAVGEVDVSGAVEPSLQAPPGSQRAGLDVADASPPAGLLAFSFHHRVQLLWIAGESHDPPAPKYGEKIAELLGPLTQAISRNSVLRDILAKRSKDVTIRFDTPGDQKHVGELSDPDAMYLDPDDDPGVIKEPTLVLFRREFLKGDRPTTDPTDLFATIMHEAYHYLLKPKGWSESKQHAWMAKHKIDDLVHAMKEFDQSVGLKHSNEWYEAIAWDGLKLTKAWGDLPQEKIAQIEAINSMEVRLKSRERKQIELDSLKGDKTPQAEEKRRKLESEIAKIDSELDWELYAKTHPR